MQSTLLRALGMAACLALLAAPLAAPVSADMRSNAFLMALSNAGITYPHPAGAVALGQSVCPMLISPRESFEHASLCTPVKTPSCVELFC